MLSIFKKKCYFLIASYFKFWAHLRLIRWKPLVVVVTGSSGKTTLLHLLESQIGTQARYSHRANSAFGVPFHILGVSRHSFSPVEWLWLFVQAPLALLAPLPREHIYIVEADCDRPGEGAFLATLLQPDITLLLTTSRTHAQNFDQEVASGRFSSVDHAIAHEFGYFLAHTKKTIYIPGDSPLVAHQLPRTTATVMQYRERDCLKDYRVAILGTSFTLAGKKHTFDGVVLPKDVWLAIIFCEQVVTHLQLPYDYSYRHFSMPPGRGLVLRGIKNTTLLDSSYNANYDSMRSTLELFGALQAPHKWIVLGDMVELGEKEDEEHHLLGVLLASLQFERLILIGPRLKRATLPLVRHMSVVAFDQPKDALQYIQKTLAGDELLLFKGSRFLEGILEQLLADTKDTALLCRREQVWRKRRKQWGL